MGASDDVRNLSQPSACHNTGVLRQMHKLAICLNRFLFSLATTFIADHAGDALLESYSSDGTPLRTRVFFSEELAGVKVRRSGTASSEWCIERIFLTSRGKTCTYMVGPTVMEDKTAWTHYNIQCF